MGQPSSRRARGVYVRARASPPLLGDLFRETTSRRISRLRYAAMADTNFIKRVIEPHLRRELETRFPGHRFEERAVALPGGVFKCDAVSEDGTIVACFLSNRAKTGTGNENTGGVRKALDDVHLLKAVSAQRRLLICTDAPFRDLVVRRSRRVDPSAIEFVHLALPPNLQRELDQTLDASRREQRSSNDWSDDALAQEGPQLSSRQPNAKVGAELLRRVVVKPLSPAFGGSASGREVGALLTDLPDYLTTLWGPYAQRTGYRSWKSGAVNWLQWNDPGDSPRKRLETLSGATETWEVFARFGRQPGSLWAKPAKYEPWKWMPSGDDVWGCTRASLLSFHGDNPELRNQLIADLTSSRDYSIGQYGH